MRYMVRAYNRHSLGGQREYFFSTEMQARDKRAYLLVTLPAEYVVEIWKAEDDRRIYKRMEG